MRWLPRLAVSMLTACGKSAPPDPNAAVCDQYATLALECVEDVPANERAVFEAMSRDFCRKGMSRKHDDMFGETYVAMIECTRSAETCEAYRACKTD